MGSTSAVVVGGGINSSANLVLKGSSVTGSTLTAEAGSSSATAVGGGLTVNANLTLVKTTVDQNHLNAHATGAGATAAGGGVSVSGRASVSASTISRNTLKPRADGAAHTAQAFGGGLYMNGSDPVAITNSTIANNTLNAVSDAATGTTVTAGGGLLVTAAPLNLLNSTVVRNQVGGQGHTTTTEGGGIRRSGGTTTIEASILGLNTAGAGKNCKGAVHSAGFNVVGTTNGCGFAAKPSDDIGVDPKVGALGNHGGPTLTVVPMPASPAVDSIPAAACEVGLDQRGVHRPQHARCDGGSVEIT
jgi:hypothetical protein